MTFTEWACPWGHPQQMEGVPPLGRWNPASSSPGHAQHSLLGPPPLSVSAHLLNPWWHYSITTSRSRRTIFSWTTSQHTPCLKLVSAFLMWPVPAGLQLVSKSFLPRSHFWSPQNQTRSPTVYRGSHPKDLHSQSRRLLTNPSIPRLMAEGVLAQVCTG